MNSVKIRYFLSHCVKPLATLILIELLYLPLSTCYVQVPLFNIGYNYYANLETHGSTFPVVIDTGNSELTLLNSSTGILKYPQSSLSQYNCLTLVEDSSFIYFYTGLLPGTRLGPASFSVPNCGSTSGIVTFENLKPTSVNLTFNVVNSLEITNENLHNWTASKGDIGLGYVGCSLGTQCSLTQFQTILLNVTSNKAYESNPIAENFQYYYADIQLSSEPYSLPSSFSNSSMIFGLDLWPSNSLNPSTMQLGFIKTAYISEIEWYSQPVDFPTYHEFTMFNPRLCGAQLLGNYSSSITTIVDTGNVCLTLPQEMYNAFIAYLNLTTPISIEEFPPFSFSANQDSTEQYFIPVESLLLPASIFLTEPGAPIIDIRGGSEPMRLCVLSGESIESSSGALVILGTLALHSLYFAADFTNNAVGLANKLSSSEISSLNQRVSSGNSICPQRITCFGDQTYDPQLNTCTVPPCDRYFFTELDVDKGSCVFNNTAYGFGVAFVVAVAFMEIMSYFTVQYTAHVALESAPPEITSFAKSRIDVFTQKVGKITTIVMDFFIVEVFHWVDGPGNEPIIEGVAEQ